jgi:hypothetical protein
MMKTRPAMLLFTCALLLMASGARGQATAPSDQTPSSASAQSTSTQNLNTQEYITLLRQDVRSQKAKLMGSVMQLDADDAVKFWPIYKEYQSDLEKLNDKRVANIHEYSEVYTAMTDEKADQLVNNALEFLKLRNELLAKYYTKMKEALGAITAARFVQVEHQLLLIIDLQIASELPIVGS